MRVAVDKGKRTDISNRTDLCRVNCCSRIPRKALRRRSLEYLLCWNECLWVVFWLRGGGKRRVERHLQVGSVTQKQILSLASILVIGSAVMGYVLTSFTDADLAYPDSFTTVASFIAMYLSARKYLESWYLWFIVDVVQVILYLIKGIELYALLYFIYLVMAFLGWRAWRASARGVPIGE